MNENEKKHIIEIIIHRNVRTQNIHHDHDVVYI